MNNIFEIDSECQRRSLNISTFQIIPMTKILGLLEWVDKTKVIKEVLEREL
jgi:DNA-dependent protein kinase catalytic subunit